MTIEEVRAFLDKNPSLKSPFHRSPHRAGCTAADLVYDVAERRSKLRYWKNRLAAVVGRSADKEHDAAHQNLLDVARRAAEKTRRKKSLVTIAPELSVVEVTDSKRPPVPAGRKSLSVIN
jgi:hypothetical protein